MSDETEQPNSTPQETEQDSTTTTTTEEPKSLVNEEPAAEVVPLSAEQIQLPDGFETSPELIAEFVETMNNGEMSPIDRANALIALQTKALTAASEANSQMWTKMQDDWQTEVKNDPELGREKLQPTLANISKLVSEFGSDELRGVFDMTGAGNNIHVIRFLSKIADKLTEGGAVQGAPAATEKSVASALYPSMKG